MPKKDIMKEIAWIYPPYPQASTLLKHLKALPKDAWIMDVRTKPAEDRIGTQVDILIYTDEDIKALEQRPAVSDEQSEESSAPNN